MTTLEDLWCGNIQPTKRTIRRGSELDNLLKRLCQNEDDLMQGLTEKQKETFGKFKDAYSELYCCFEKGMFAQDFIIATKIMIEVITESKSDLL